MFFQKHTYVFLSKSQRLSEGFGGSGRQRGMGALLGRCRLPAPAGALGLIREEDHTRAVAA